MGSCRGAGDGVDEGLGCGGSQQRRLSGVVCTAVVGSACSREASWRCGQSVVGFSPSGRLSVALDLGQLLMPGREPVVLKPARSSRFPVQLSAQPPGSTTLAAKKTSVKNKNIWWF
jgi:hypothetical protein